VSRSRSGPEAPTTRQKKRGPQRGIVWRDVERLAAVGVELDDIIAELDLPPAAVDLHRGRLVQTVETGHAKQRAQIAQRLNREGVRKGRAHALLSLARNRLGFDKNVPEQQEPPDTIGITSKLLNIIDKMVKNNPRLLPAACSRCKTACGGCGAAEVETQKSHDRMETSA